VVAAAAAEQPPRVLPAQMPAIRAQLAVTLPAARQIRTWLAAQAQAAALRAALLLMPAVPAVLLSMAAVAVVAPAAETVLLATAAAPSMVPAAAAPAAAPTAVTLLARPVRVV
jgi:hypothetical protein